MKTILHWALYVTMCTLWCILKETVHKKNENSLSKSIKTNLLEIKHPFNVNGFILDTSLVRFFVCISIQCFHRNEFKKIDKTYFNTWMNLWHFLIERGLQRWPWRKRNKGIFSLKLNSLPLCHVTWLKNDPQTFLRLYQAVTVQILQTFLLLLQVIKLQNMRANG